MRNLILTGLTTLFLISAVLQPAQAGRRARRRGRRTAVVAGVAGGAAAAAVVATRRRDTTVVAAPRRPAAPVVVVQPLPDLTIAQISEEDSVHCVVVRNIGDAAAVGSLMQVDFAQVADGALLSSSSVQVPPLLPGQSVRIRLHSIPSGHVVLQARVDADALIAESNERNNVSQFEIVPKIIVPEIAPPPAELPDVDAWLGPEPMPPASDNSAEAHAE